MPQMTREMIIKQRNAHQNPYSSRPLLASSNDSTRSSSPQPSLSSSCSSPASTRSSASGKSSHPSGNLKQCWIPTLDEVSRADPEERARMFERLAREADRDARANGIPRKYTPASNTKPTGSSVEIGVMALQLVRPNGSRPIEHPTLGAPAPTWNRVEEHEYSKLSQEERAMFSEWLVDMPESPATSSWGVDRQRPSEDMIARWAQEDAEMERRAQEERAWKMAYAN